MKLLTLFFISFAFIFSVDWGNDMASAQKRAIDENKYILLNFSGSDWCAPCILLKKEVFANEEFIQLASEKLILMRADFPRMKKNRLPETEMSKNEALAEKYNTNGKFPLTLLLDSNGKVIKEWDGYQGNKIEFISSLKAALP